MKALTPRRSLLPLAAMSLASLGWGQGAPAAASPATPNPAAPAAAAAVPAPTATPADTAATAPATPSVAAPAAAAATNAAGGDHILPAPDRTTPTGSTLAGGLASSSTVAAIQRQEFDKREQLLTEVAGRVQEADRQINELKQKASGLEADAKQSLDAAIADYDKAKAKLQQSLDASRNTQANTWERARVSLATDYAFYVAAAAAVEVAAPNS